MRVKIRNGRKGTWYIDRVDETIRVEEHDGSYYRQVDTCNYILMEDCEIIEIGEPWTDKRQLPNVSSDTPMPNVKQPLPSKYHREIKPDIWIDVYDVLKAFDVRNPATAHAIKKLLAPGKRGVKSIDTDLSEAIQSIERARQLEQ